jgi:hypothetical protein
VTPDRKKIVAKQKATRKRNDKIRKATLDHVGRRLHAMLDGLATGRRLDRRSSAFDTAMDRVDVVIRTQRGNLTQVQYDQATHRRAVGQAFMLAARLVENALAGERTFTDGVPSAFMLQVHRVLVLANAKGVVRTVKEPKPSWLDFGRPGTKL